MQKLPGNYVAGFVDGEGCFALKFRRDVRYERKNTPVYFYWDIEFAIMLRSDDKELLQSILATLRCGRISVNRAGGARYSVQHIEDLVSKIVPFFDQYQLHGKKRFDFELWKEAVQIFQRSQQQRKAKGERYFRKKAWGLRDLQRLREIHQAMKQYKSKGNEWKWLAQASS